MIYTIQNQHLTVQIEDLGAQLASIQDARGREFLWQGSPESWNRRAPLLFPIIGRLKDSTYQLDGVSYKMPNHGFARDLVFEAVSQSGQALSLRLDSSEETRKVYPFDFSLTVTYTLEENRLIKSHEVENKSDREMLYELGAHDGFRAAVSQDAIQVEGMETVRLYGMDQDNLLTPPDREVSARLPLTPMTYGRDTMIFDNPGCARLHTAQGEVVISAQDFLYMGVWTPDRPFDTGFVCIEPWSTLPDGTFMGRELADKPGVRRLSPGQKETLLYTTSICGTN